MVGAVGMFFFNVRPRKGNELAEKKSMNNILILV
jgi:hypothetical protein